jgi:TM2 domain-containing membrane protein YozV
MLASEVTVCGRCGNRFVAADVPIAPPPPLPDMTVSYPPPTAIPVERKQKIVAISLALALGGIGAHGFYLGNNNMGLTLAVMFVGGGALGILFFLFALAGALPMWLTAVGIAPLLIAATIPMIQAARYGVANAEQFHQRYVVEKRWF